MTPTSLSERTTMIVGASRGLGRGIATAFAQADATVIAVARTEAALADLAVGAPAIQPEVVDAADATAAGTLLDRHDPEIVVLVAGATPLMRPLQHQTWETFSVNWHTDVRIAFNWLRESLLKPLRPGSLVVVISSGAAQAGSPLSGGYAGAKATQRFITAYAQGRGKPGRSGHHLHRGSAPDHAADRPRSAGGQGVRGSQRTVRAGVSAADGRTAHPRARRRRPGGTCESGDRLSGSRLPSERRRAGEASLTGPRRPLTRHRLGIRRFG